MSRICAVVPVLNEADNIDELISRLGGALGQISADYQIVVVDDGSTDGTWAALRNASRYEGRLHAIRFSRNFGQHMAITAGLERADADWVVVMDGDLQDRPEVIPDLYARAQEGFDIVFVERQERPESTLYLAGQRLFYATLRNLTDGDYNASQGNFSIISRKVVDAYNRLNERTRFYGGLLQWLGFNRASMPAIHGQRFAGATSYNFIKRLRFAKQIILAFSTRPLDITLLIGLTVTVAALGFGGLVLIQALFFGYPVQGWASLIVSIYFIGGVQMIMIGMVGLYVGRISEEVKHRPTYVTVDVITPQMDGDAA